MAYTIKSGDTLSGIAAANKTTVADIMKLNPNITDANKISAGASLNLAASSPISTGGNTVSPPTGFTSPVSVPPAASPYMPDLSQAKASNASYQSILDIQKQQMEQKSAEKAAAEKVQGGKPTSFLDWLKDTGQQTANEYATSQYGAIGYDPAEYFADLKVQTAKIDALNKDLNDTTAQRDQQISNVIGRGGVSLDFQNNSIAQINRNANVVIEQKEGNINTEVALMNAKQGNWKQAQDFVNSAVNAYTNQLNTDLSMTMDFYKDNQDMIKELGNEFDDAFNGYIDTLKTDLAQAKVDAQNKIDNDFKQQGLNIQMMQERRLSAEAGGGGGGGTVGTNRFDNGLQSLMTEKPGLSAGQLYDLYISSNDLTSAEQKEAWGRAQLIAGNPAANEPTNPSVTSPATQSLSELQKRVAILEPIYKDTGMSWRVDLRNDLMKEGYKPEDIMKVMPISQTGIEDFFTGVYNSLFQ